MQRLMNMGRKKKRGFTLIEAMVVAAIGAVILGTMYKTFSSGVRSSMKGTDQLESIRAASTLFAELRKDLLACQSVDADGAVVVMPVGMNTLPSPLVFKSKVTFLQRNATTTYVLQMNPDGRGSINRQVFENGTLKSTRQFAVPRMKNFEAVQIFKQQQIAGGGEVFQQGQLLIRIAVDSGDKRFPSGIIHLSSFFITSQLSATTWWNYYYPGP